MIYSETPLVTFKSVAAVFGWKRAENQDKDIVLRRIEEVKSSLENTMKEHFESLENAMKEYFQTKCLVANIISIALYILLKRP